MADTTTTPYGFPHTCTSTTTLLGTDYAAVKGGA
jgi:hypothetical protein